MIKKKEKYLKLKQYGIILLLIAITLGFTVPGFLQGDGSEQGPVNPADIKTCFSDRDCYLTCDDGLESIMCYKNICEIDSCEYAPLYEFDPIGADFSMSMSINNENIDLAPYFSQYAGDTFFMTINENDMKLFTNRLPLGYILEKVGVQLQESCIQINGTQYCEDETHEILLDINGEERYLSNEIVISQGDTLNIRFE